MLPVAVSHKHSKTSLAAPQYYPKEECGIVAVYNVEEAANHAYLGAYALQHRGQESAGIVSSDGERLYRYAGMGKVADVFTPQKIKQLTGQHAIAHNRYSTTGASFLRNAQPIRFESRLGTMALAHNGNLTNAATIRKGLEDLGSLFQTTIDTEVISHLIARSRADNFTDALIEAVKQIRGAYSLVVLTGNTLYALRDPNGFRPLVMGKKDEGFVFASETCALDIIDAEYVRDVEPGELITVTARGIESVFPFGKSSQNLCIFEYVYFARPDSYVFGKSVYNTRMRMGEILAEESPVLADLVMPVPDSSSVAALGYSRKSGIPYHMGLIRSHYVGRTFIEPDQKIRDFGAKIKYNAIASVVKGKRVIVIDDSIMRGTTTRKIVKMLRNAGAKEIHVRIASAPTRHPCYYGIDIPHHSELIAATHTIEEIIKYLRVDSLAYLSLEGMQRGAEETPTGELSGGENSPQASYCTACFDGKYPVRLEENEAIYSNQKTLFSEYEIEESA
ncbi:MAG: amidophosphoribosyltransferase [Spirochaetes bacterium]|nr:amidophosphoribosyltransferase [Spirochaetota bacterium]MBX3722658.1 amidophosphoribosyltransferase [Turneriella sp.]